MLRCLTIWTPNVLYLPEQLGVGIIFRRFFTLLRGNWSMMRCVWTRGTGVSLSSTLRSVNGSRFPESPGHRMCCFAWQIVRAYGHVTSQHAEAEYACVSVLRRAASWYCGEQTEKTQLNQMKNPKSPPCSRKHNLFFTFLFHFHWSSRESIPVSDNRLVRV